MSEEKPEPEKACKIKLKPDPETGWKLNLDGWTPECLMALEQIAENVGPHGKELLAKRIEVSDPKVKKFLQELGLAKGEELTKSQTTSV
jgi:hypothetical protein